MSEESANPDTEILNACRPGLLSVEAVSVFVFLGVPMEPLVGDHIEMAPLNYAEAAVPAHQNKRPLIFWRCSDRR